MDLVVIGEWDTLPLHSLAQALLKNGVCNENIQVLDKASVSFPRSVISRFKYSFVLTLFVGKFFRM